MTLETRFLDACEQYRAIGVDPVHALDVLQRYAISMHCWQGDDVTGFDHDGPLTGGIQATGNYPARRVPPKN